MQIQITRAEPPTGAVTVSAAGELDVAEVDEFEQAVVGCAGPGVGVVGLDLAGIAFLGSLGIATLLRCWTALGADGILLTITHYSDIVQRVLSAVGLLEQLTGPQDSESVGLT